MNNDNPYASTMAASSGGFSQGTEVSAAVVDQLKRTGGWATLMGVMFWIGAGFSILGGLAMMALTGIAGASAAADVGLAAMGGPIVIGVIYIVFAFIYIYPALKLTKYGSSCKKLSNNPSEDMLVTALNEQRAFWKYAGIMVLVMIVVWVAFFAFAIVAGGIAAAAAGGGVAP